MEIPTRGKEIQSAADATQNERSYPRAGSPFCAAASSPGGDRLFRKIRCSKVSFEREEWRSDSNSNGTVTSEFQTIKIEELIFWSSGAKKNHISWAPAPPAFSAEPGRAWLSSAELGRGRPNSNIKRNPRCFFGNRWKFIDS